MPRAKPISTSNYEGLVADLSRLLEDARRVSARAVNSLMTTTYWEFGRRIVEFEQGGEKRAGYGEELVARLAADLTARFGRGFGAVNLSQMKRFYLLWQNHTILQTPSEKSSGESIQTLSEESPKQPRFPLPWSHYVRLMAVKSETARRFYETEALRGGWSVRQLDRRSTPCSTSAPRCHATSPPCSPRARRRGRRIV
ncbi:MAG: DUF1016 N-terminal domain-containing protein [Opitutaceae bacterium]